MTLSPRLKSLLRPTLGKVGLSGMGLCLALGAFAPPAAAAMLDELPIDNALAWEEPVKYSTQLMTLGIAGLVAFDLHDADPSYDNFASVLASPAPRPDDDGPVFNYVLHPLWGSETYLRARAADFSPTGSFAFSMGASVAWEYLVESWTEHPSRQDLIYTTGLGWMLGETRHQMLQTTDGHQRKLLDPLYTTFQHVNIGATMLSPDNPTPRLQISWSI